MNTGLSVSIALSLACAPAVDSGSGAETEAKDTQAATGTETFTGTAASTEAADTQAAAGSLFRPSDLGSTLKFWGKTGGYNASTGVWTDASGNGHDAISISTHPTAGTAINSLATVHFPGAGSQALQIPAITLGALTFAAVVKLTSTAGFIAVFNTDAGAGGYVYGSLGYTLYEQRASTASSKELTSNWAVDNVAKSLIHRFDGTHAGSKLAIGGVDQTLSNGGGGTGNPGTSTASWFTYLAADQAGAVRCTGDYGEVVLCDSSITDTQTANLAAYFKEIWGSV